MPWVELLTSKELLTSLTISSKGRVEVEGSEAEGLVLGAERVVEEESEETGFIDSGGS